MSQFAWCGTILKGGFSQKPMDGCIGLCDQDDHLKKK